MKGNEMFFIRVAFWLCVVIMFLPAEPTEGRQMADDIITAGQAIEAAEQAVADLGGICDRNTELCQTGGQIGQVFMSKARNGARMLYDYLDGDETAPGASGGAETG
jgi:hypothetical protein